MAKTKFEYDNPEVFVFPCEAFRRYYLWSGASESEAQFSSVWMDDLRFEGRVEGTFLPMKKDGSGRHDFQSLFGAMRGFSDVLLEKGFKPSEFLVEDPYDLTRNVDDMIVPTPGAEVVADPIIVGLAGGRLCGKSFLSEQLAKIGFLEVHPFRPGKALLRGYYVTRGASEAEAWEMTEGKPGGLKDSPAPRDVLPVDPRTGKNMTSRYMMELLGKFMAEEVGLDSTLGREMCHWQGAGARKLLVGSVAYEADYLQDQGVPIIGITVPEEKRINRDIVAEQTGAAIAKMRIDVPLVNTMEGADKLMADLRDGMAAIGFSLDDAETAAPAPGA